MVEARPLLPVALAVAAAAVAAQRALVLVVLQVAVDALARELVAVQAARVAALARRQAMPADQRVACVGVVVEADALPVAGGVAGVALVAEAGPVLVVLPVAGDAGLRRVLVVTRPCGSSRTSPPSCLPVSGKRVVAWSNFASFHELSVWQSAHFGAERALVRVVLAVAGDAVASGDAKPLAGHMALLAVDPGVSAAQGKLVAAWSKLVLSRLASRGVAPLVLAVTGLAGLRLHRP